MSARHEASTTDRGSEPAYPRNILDVPFKEANDGKYHGVTIREEFASRAMQGLLANVEMTKSIGEKYPPSMIARAAVISADALLEELEKGASDEKV